jgi:hypothetical protein
MKQIQLPIPELMGIAATRGMLGAGLALLLGDRLEDRQRRRLGAVLTAIGVVSTIPFMWDILCRRDRPS